MQYLYAGKTSDDGMRNKEQHEGKGKGWACNNHNMRNTIIKDAGRGYACYDCCMPIPCLCLHAAPYFSCHHHGGQGIPLVYM